MFGWFKRTSKPASDDQKTADAIEHIQTLVAAYGRLIEQYPVAIVDASMLPIPKEGMKRVLQTAYRINNDPARRNLIEVGYMHLSRFQEGVGHRPLDPTLPPTPDPAQVANILGPWLVWEKKSQAEAKALMAEFKEFRQQHSI